MAPAGAFNIAYHLVDNGWMYLMDRWMMHDGYVLRISEMVILVDLFDLDIFRHCHCAKTL
jgi:hypothetical protein